MKFLNRFVETSSDMREKIQIQTELEEAGFEPVTLNKFLLGGPPDPTVEGAAGKEEMFRDELNRWTQVWSLRFDFPRRKLAPLREY